MEDNILKAAISLSEALKNDPRMKLLNELEAKLEASDEVKILSYRLDMASMNYSDALKIYDPKSEEIKPYIKALQTAKVNINNVELVKQYNKAYQDVKDMLNNINEEVFNEFRFPLKFKN